MTPEQRKSLEGASSGRLREGYVCTVLQTDLRAALERIDELERISHQACPCLHTTPCDPDCTCVKGFSSRGCRRCCSYGSKEQQRAAAESLASLEATAIKYAFLMEEHHAAKKMLNDALDHSQQFQARIDELEAALQKADELADRMMEAAPLTWASGSSMEDHAYAWEKEAKPALDAFLAARARTKEQKP